MTTITNLNHASYLSDNEEENNGRQRVLILKTGYSETFATDDTGIVSLGDIVRSTVILSLLPSTRYLVSWVVDESGAALLEEIPGIEKLICVTPENIETISKGLYDIVINLEKSSDICRLAESVNATTYLGFRYCDEQNRLNTFHDSDHIVSTATDHKFRRRQERSWSELLFEMLGETYSNEPCLLPAPDGDVDINDFGLNWKVGRKYPLKGWPKCNWEHLARALESDHTVSWQQSVNDLHGYIRWVNSCRILVTNDSLGLHLALALGKKVVALFGPTSAIEIHDHINIVKLQPSVDWDCIPCLESICPHKESCMTHIPPERVIDAALSLTREEP